LIRADGGPDIERDRGVVFELDQKWGFPRPNVCPTGVRISAPRADPQTMIRLTLTSVVSAALLFLPAIASHA
jgi:hypothetical protein